MYEVEQKYRVRDPERVRKCLLKMGARKVRSGMEYNELFDFFGLLRGKQSCLRLRHHKNKQGVLTLKGPRMKSRYKKRMEIELSVGDHKVAKTLITFLGFEMVTHYKKRREEYRLGPASVTLDHLARIGWFVEIETRPARIETIRKKLGIRQADREEKTYLEILKKRY